MLWQVNWHTKYTKIVFCGSNDSLYVKNIASIVVAHAMSPQWKTWDINYTIMKYFFIGCLNYLHCLVIQVKLPRQCMLGL